MRIRVCVSVRFSVRLWSQCLGSGSGLGARPLTLALTLTCTLTLTLKDALSAKRSASRMGKMLNKEAANDVSVLAVLLVCVCVCVCVRGGWRAFQNPEIT